MCLESKRPACSLETREKEIFSGFSQEAANEMPDHDIQRRYQPDIERHERRRRLFSQARV